MEPSKGDIQPIPRNPLRFDLLHLFEAHLRAQGGTLHDPEAPGEFFASLGEPLTTAIGDSTLLRGLRAEALFEALVVSLGQVDLLKQEDSGRVWTGRGGLKVADFRIVLQDGTRFLAEVKHFHGGTPDKAFSISPNYLAGLQAYEDAVGCPVKLAVYWSQWNLWTLVPLTACKNKGRPSLSLEQAMKTNEMGILGDMLVGTEFPLRFRIIADPGAERRLGKNGQVAFTIGGIEMYCRDRLLTKKREQSIAMWFMLYGPWEEKATAEISGGELVGVDFIRTPPVDSGQGFELVGALSSLFSTMYLGSTSDEDRVTRLGIQVTSGSLGSMIPGNYKSEALPLWRLHVMPPQAGSESDLRLRERLVDGVRQSSRDGGYHGACFSVPRRHVRGCAPRTRRAR